MIILLGTSDSYRDTSKSKVTIPLVTNDYEINEGAGQSEGNTSFMSTINMDIKRYANKQQLLNSLWARSEKFYNSYVIFSDESVLGYRRSSGCVYYNQNVICKNVENFYLNTFNKNGNTMLEVYVEFENKAYNTEYSF